MTIFKQIPSEDRVSTRTLLHEAIPITGTILSGTYGTLVDGTNIKNFSHGMFQSVYDYPYLSSSANHIFDISIGTSEDSSLVVSSQPTKKDNIYNQMAQVLAGYNKDGNIQKFDEDGDLTGGTKIDNCIFVNFSRLLVKDEIKKGSFQMTLGINEAYATPMSKLLDITDHQGATSFRVNSPAGEYGILYASSSTAGLLDPAASQKVDIGGSPYWKAGIIYYQAGIAVLSSSILSTTGSIGGLGMLTGIGATKLDFNGSGQTLTGSIIANEISSSANFLRHRVKNIQFNNTIELNSTVYFCRVKHNEFNYSANPTYLTGSQIRIKQDATDIPISYITSIGLYSADNQLLAVGKFSEPIRKDNNIELTFRARLDY